jgi:hypothetical protein
MLHKSRRIPVTVPELCSSVEAGIDPGHSYRQIRDDPSPEMLLKIGICVPTTTGTFPGTTTRLRHFARLYRDL